MGLHVAGGQLQQPRLQLTALVLAAPGPGVAEPQRGQQVQSRRLGPAVGGRDLNQQVIRAGLGVFHRDLEVAVLGEHSRILQLKLALVPAAPAVFLAQARIRELGLWVVVDGAHVAVRRRAGRVEIRLLHILAVVALGPGQAEQPFLQDGVAAVPHREAEAQPALAVGDAEQTVLAPAVGAAGRVIEGEIFPRLAVGRVILAHRAPLPLGEIRAPALPVPGPVGVLGKTDMFNRGRGRLHHKVEATRRPQLGTAKLGAAHSRRCRGARPVLLTKTNKCEASAQEAMLAPFFSFSTGVSAATSAGKSARWAM